jgi:hypothetical protein
MDISNLGNINNLVPSVTTPSIPNKTVEQKVPQKTTIETPVTQDTTNKQRINLTSQSFSNILLEIGLPNTTQNNQLANLLANYGQAINKQSMTQFSNALGHLMNKGSLSMEAGVVLLLNGLDLSKNNLEAVKQLLSGGGLSQNLLSLNKDLQKMISSISGQDLKSEISQAVKNREIQNNNKLENQNEEENIELQKLNIKDPNNLEENKVHETTQVRKNPFDDLENKKELLENTSKQINKLGNDINKNIINILTIDVLKNPSMFPMQISMLKKYFFELEKDIDQLKKILKDIFGEISEDDENIFTELLKLVVDEKVTKTKNNNMRSENVLKEIYKSLNSINLNLVARDILNKPNESMCLPLLIPFNNTIINAELMITREDRSNKKNEIGNIPLKIQLLMETNNLGKVSIEINNLKKDLQVNLALENEKIKRLFKEKVYLLENNLKDLPFEVREIQCNINRKQNDNNSILLPQKYKVMSMKRIDGVM